MQSQNDGAIAQLVEQRTENPCVPDSIPGGTTQKSLAEMQGFFGFLRLLPGAPPLFHAPAAPTNAVMRTLLPSSASKMALFVANLYFHNASAPKSPLFDAIPQTQLYYTLSGAVTIKGLYFIPFRV